ncbi:hypothetical protein AVEN_183234-1 [Araneus ventricosus]|uniref:DUF4817 domain-containing protein n=1 Tax=Araneus ventricosus TaxID=182803 RepID=A0A4Y2T8M5_ARAVE|nr:hypothetical protein AVEN_183234-1 [Araneus ventricosus]
MCEFTKADLTDIHIACGAVEYNEPAAMRLYCESFQRKGTAYHTSFATLHQKLCGGCSSKKAIMNRERTTLATAIDNSQKVVQLRVLLQRSCMNYFHTPSRAELQMSYDEEYFFSENNFGNKRIKVRAFYSTAPSVSLTFIYSHILQPQRPNLNCRFPE